MINSFKINNNKIQIIDSKIEEILVYIKLTRDKHKNTSTLKEEEILKLEKIEYKPVLINDQRYDIFENRDRGIKRI